MKQVRLQFRSAAEVWDFLAATRKTHIDIEAATAEGWFTPDELELACQEFEAEVQPFTPPATAPTETIPVVTQDITVDKGQPIDLYGKSGRIYPGMIYTKASSTSALPAQGLVCLANSALTNNTWQHAVNAIYATDNVEGERERFCQRDDVSHFIVVPSAAWAGTDAPDDLIRSYLHG